MIEKDIEYDHDTRYSSVLEGNGWERRTLGCVSSLILCLLLPLIVFCFFFFLVDTFSATSQTFDVYQSNLRQLEQKSSAPSYLRSVLLQSFLFLLECRNAHQNNLQMEACSFMARELYYKYVEPDENYKIGGTCYVSQKSCGTCHQTQYPHHSWRKERYFLYLRSKHVRHMPVCLLSH